MPSGVLPAWCSSPARPAPARRQRSTPRLTELNSPEKKIITVEDPVEYRLPGINQVQVHEKIDLSFERVLRSALRQDPISSWSAKCATR